VFLGDGNILEFSGGYSDWFSYKDRYFAEFYSAAKASAAADELSSATNANGAPSVAITPAPVANRSKLSYKEKSELEQLPDLLAKFEAEQVQLNQQLQDPELYKSDPDLATKYHARVAEIDDLLIEKLARWEDLEARST
jgi:ATP-binding cassette subfamily F protein uup